MCSPVRCASCGKTTWAGCGQHADDVMRQVPIDQRCPGHDDRPVTDLSGWLPGR